MPLASASGSITKTIVATLALDAVSRGQLTLESSVNDQLPGTLRTDQPVTVRMILDHTSGIFDETNEATDILGDLNRIADPSLRAEALDVAARAASGERVIASARIIVAAAETHDRYFAPGQGFHYSNVNYQLAAMVLERVTGQSLAQLIQSLRCRWD